jgi:hypothetical protein
MNKLIQYLKNLILLKPSKKTQDRLIQYLNNEIWFRARPSKVDGGIGLFAIRDIPKGTDIMVEFDGKGKTYFSIEKAQMQDIHPNVRQLWKDYWQNNDIWQHIYLPPNYKRIHLFYLNHSSNPSGNLKCGVNILKFITNKDIKEGDEIFEDYNRLPLHQ